MEAHSALSSDLDCFDFLHYLGWLPGRTCISFMFSETLLPPAKIKVKKIIQTNKTQFSNWEGREGKELKILGTKKEDSVEVWGQLFKALVAGIWLRTAHKYIFLFPLKKPRLRSQ